MTRSFGENSAGEIPGVSPAVDFAAIAERSIANGIFVFDPAVEGRNRTEGIGLPTSTLDALYKTGPLLIKA